MGALPQVAFPPRDPPDSERDDHVVLYGIDWNMYCAVRELFEDRGVRMAYLNGALEITSPSRKHEGYKARIAQLIRLFALERDIPFYAHGAPTLRKELAARGVEPDECYVLGHSLGEDEYPHIALEVVISSGGIDKLQIYAGLGVHEVWFWHKGAFHLYLLRDSGYEPASHSELIPSLDFAELAHFAEDTDQPAALKRYRQFLQTR
jgi:Uma2 family endonuclease